MAADAAELVNAGVRADRGVIIDADMAAERGAIAEDGVTAQVTVVGDVHVRHEQVAVPDRGLATATRGATIDRDELAERVALADDEPRPLALVLQILRRQADRGHREDHRLVPDRGLTVDDDGGADHAAGADRDIGTNRAVRTDDRPLADPRRWVDARARVDLARMALDANHQLGLGDRLIGDKRRGMHLRQPGTHASDSHVQPQPIAGDHLTAKLRVVDAAQPRPRRRRRLCAFEHQHRSHLRQGLDHEHARHDRHPGEVPLEEFLTDRDVLVRNQTHAGFVLGDRVDQERGIAVVDAVEKGWKVYGHDVSGSR